MVDSQFILQGMKLRIINLEDDDGLPSDTNKKTYHWCGIFIIYSLVELIFINPYLIL